MPIRRPTRADTLENVLNTKPTHEQMKTLKELRKLQAELEPAVGASYFMFVAPVGNDKWNSVGVGRYISEDEQIPDYILEGAGELDLYFMRHDHHDDFKDSETSQFRRFGVSGVPKD